jgi:uncharacterized membrane protein YfcA
MIEFDIAFALACAVVLFATIVAGLAGFGLTIISVPPLLLIYEPASVIALMKILTLGTTWVILIDAWRFISWRWIVRILPMSLAGLFLGSYLLRILNADIIVVAAGAIVFVLAVRLLSWHPGETQERGWMAPLVGFTSGTSSTLTGMPGPPLVVFLTAMQVETQVFRATSAMYFISLDVVGLPTLISQGTVTAADVGLSLWLAPVAIVGRFLGGRLVPYVSPLAFRRATVTLLMVTGVVSMVNGGIALV